MGLFDYLFGIDDTDITENDLTDEEKEAFQLLVDSRGESLGRNYHLYEEKKFIKFALKKGAIVSLDKVGSNLKNDREIVLLAIQKNPGNFHYASSEVKNMESVCLEFMKKNDGKLSDEIGDKVKDSYDFMIKAIFDYDWNNIRFASDRLKNDLDFCKQAIKKNYGVSYYFGYKVKEDKDFMSYIEVYK